MNRTLIVRCALALALTLIGTAGADPTTGAGGGVGKPVPVSPCC